MVSDKEGKIKIQGFLKLYDLLKVIDLDLDIVETAKTVQGFELHDRLIVASALSLQVPILTYDQAIQKTHVVTTIWK
jgi:PIN domain nuclease of toxin-antitoxin system